MDILNDEFSVIYSVDGDSLIGHVFENVNLGFAFFDNLDLTGVTFKSCSFYQASFKGANLKNSKFIDCDFSGFADGAFNNADLTGIDFGVSVPIVKDLDEKICAILSTGEGTLKMESWHDDEEILDQDPEEFVKTCGTTHCIAGWAITLAGAQGYALEKAFDPATAGTMIYAKSTGVIPNFYEDNTEALEHLEQRVQKACTKE